MKKRMQTVLLLAMMMFVMVSSAWADIGPKASVRVSFRDLEEGTWYGTLLSREKSTGPASVYDGSFGGRPQEFIQDNRAVDGPESEAVWQAFQDYAEGDDYCFLQRWWTCSEESGIEWTYYPPYEFKVLLYHPETGAFRVSEATERYAFDSYFEAAPGEENSLTLRHNYHYGVELMGLAARVVLTILLELGVAWLFRYREKKALVLIGVVNVVTQLGLNVMLNLINYKSGQMAYFFAFIPLELLVFAVEAIAYRTGLRKLRSPEQMGRPVLYAFAANLLSFGLGLWLSFLIPGIF